MFEHGGKVFYSKLLQSMLSNPVLEDAVNSDAVQMLVHHPHAYKQMVQDCVSASQRVEGSLNSCFLF